MYNNGIAGKLIKQLYNLAHFEEKKIFWKAGLKSFSLEYYKSYDERNKSTASQVGAEGQWHLS